MLPPVIVPGPYTSRSPLTIITLPFSVSSVNARSTVKPLRFSLTRERDGTVNAAAPAGAVTSPLSATMPPSSNAACSDAQSSASATSSANAVSAPKGKTDRTISSDTKIARDRLMP